MSFESSPKGQISGFRRDKIYLSTTASDGAEAARRWGLGIEIAEYCTAWNMDDEFAETDVLVRRKLEGISRRIFHAPFNELFPCAIDRKARQLAAERYRQAIQLAKTYGAEKVVVHGGYNGWMYYPEWYTAQSILFWKEFLAEDPGVEIVLENVLEEDPAWLLDIVKGVDHPRLRLCLDVGHVNAYSKTPVLQWLERWGSQISHFHLHNNDGSWDTHSPLDQGSIPIRQLLQKAQGLCPEATITLELLEAEESVRWLFESNSIGSKME